MDHRVLKMLGQVCTGQPGAVAPDHAPTRHASASRPPQLTVVAPNSNVIDVWYSQRWAVFSCSDPVGNVHVFPSMRIARKTLGATQA